ncbi:hypothetical protein BJ322DRAFT_1222296 [Thelephora terrestris]|uniref:Uncharacterized protein n=1 Tax=Thelephora terrestris TaxID=56493 RepID=A0A9P6H2Y9_9AGAM|nr:hypothetical protein BJ322DRAFT_1222296 [Thelephora terrestris]
MDIVAINLNEPIDIISDDGRLEIIQLCIILEDVDKEGDLLQARDQDPFLSGDREGAQVSSVRVVATRETDRGVGSGLQAIEDLVIQLADVEWERWVFEHAQKPASKGETKSDQVLGTPPQFEPPQRVAAGYLCLTLNTDDGKLERVYIRWLGTVEWVTPPYGNDTLAGETSERVCGFRKRPGPSQRRKLKFKKRGNDGTNDSPLANCGILLLACVRLPEKEHKNVLKVPGNGAVEHDE